jgi:hypothetical protein
MKLVSVYKYAKLCGISHQAIYKRKKAGKFKTVKKRLPTGEYQDFVDIHKYPVANRTRRKKNIS